MVHVDKDETPPIGLIDSKWDSLKADLLTEKNAHKANSACYRDTTLKALIELYSNKCACCERSRGEELQVDHYRPKKARQNKDTTYNHSGYYWLSYEWSNLMPLCSSCNQSKSNYFPLKDEAKRVISPNHQFAYESKELYTHEEPLFVNPEIDLQPERHFKYLRNGEIEGRTDEGKVMVKLYKLNSKTKIRQRKIIIKSYIKKIRAALHEYSKNTDNEREAELRGDLKNTFREILNNGKKDKPLSLMHLFIRNYFGEFIAKPFPKNYQSKLLKNFDNYKKNVWRN
jgi:5-methylcytosine-specific restriction endonuclease McrA